MNIVFLKQSQNQTVCSGVSVINLDLRELIVLKRFRIHIKLVPIYEYIMRFKFEFLLSFD
jgi:hypothetical protein